MKLPPAFALAALLLTGRSALAQVTQEPEDPYPDPARFARGLYTEAEIGAVMFLGDARQPLGVGSALGFRLGFDLWRWAAVQAHGFGSSHTTRFDASPQDGQLLQIYQVSAELKLTVPLGRLSLCAWGGAGFAWLSTNLLGTTALTDPDVNRSLAFVGGLLVDYHTASRHFAFGLAPGFTRLQAVRTAGALSTTVYVRYTF